ncbi:pseudouridine synthase [Larsenimonas rhizosphaerae]|uniref:Pseudouridine synthase n=1 Tax=Larsenimonas rhizosphaerae TaxID=2944682 RepID=A0AA41ZIS3_9GAMM|nr:pseudouridine synthase [Larsenimonas rhizosphaerae]MCM2132055.1 pseudouridine synthase [Larsenimonas rhizosphaerae]MCX2524658.1 pseudouridine synthase [Larsenimonas rhizosphaerae]
MSTIYLVNKPFHMLPQFTDDQGRRTLADIITVPGIYPVGRLDYDSEGLMLLTDDGALNHRISHPRYKLTKVYWVQVEGLPNDQALCQLRQGIRLKDGPTRPAQVRHIDAPALPERDPPVRFRANQPTSWLEIRISEGRNRQVRRMTAAIGHPTLRLVRQAIGSWQLGQLAPGEWRSEQLHAPRPDRPRSARRPITRNRRS